MEEKQLLEKLINEKFKKLKEQSNKLYNEFMNTQDIKDLKKLGKVEDKMSKLINYMIKGESNG